MALRLQGEVSPGQAGGAQPRAEAGAGPRKGSPERVLCGSVQAGAGLRPCDWGEDTGRWGELTPGVSARQGGGAVALHDYFAVSRARKARRKSHSNCSFTRLFFPKPPKQPPDQGSGMTWGTCPHAGPCTSDGDTQGQRKGPRVVGFHQQAPHSPGSPPKPGPFNAKIPGKQPEKGKASGTIFPDPPVPAGACG